MQKVRSVRSVRTSEVLAKTNNLGAVIVSQKEGNIMERQSGVKLRNQ
jgi:hypothetical protein